MVEGNCGGRTDLNRYLFTCSAVFGTSTFHPLPGSKIHFAVSAVTSTKFVFVFPSLIMTDLHPGNTLTIVSLRLPAPLLIVGMGGGIT